MAVMRPAALVLSIMSFGGCTHQLQASLDPRPLDVLDFIIGDPALWPRVGSQRQDQHVNLEKREVCWTKYGRADQFECWTWDDRWVRHETDHAIDGRPGESYHFSDGRWLPRRLRPGEFWELDVTRNTQTWLTGAGSVDATNTHLFPYRLRAWQLGARDLGSDLGVRDVLVLEYAPHDLGQAPRGTAEYFYFARHAGWFSWTSGRGTARFDRTERRRDEL